MRQQRTNICIIGTGAAGGILAYRLASAGREVLSLEQGAAIADDYFTNGQRPSQDEYFGIAPERSWSAPPTDLYFESNAQARQLYASADFTSTSPEAAAVFRNRQIFRLNGRQDLWAGVSLRMAPRDFRARDCGDGELNWPIDYEDLAPHYDAVERLIGVCGTREGLSELPDGEFLPPLPLRSVDLALRSAVQGMRKIPIKAIPTRKAIETRADEANACVQCGHCVHGCRYGSIYKFSSRLLPRIVERPNYRIIYEAKVIRLRRATNSPRIEAAECLNTSTREQFEVLADNFVVSAGSLETARLLLNSHDDVWPAGTRQLLGLGWLLPSGSCTRGSLWLAMAAWWQQGRRSPRCRRPPSDPAFPFRRWRVPRRLPDSMRPHSTVATILSRRHAGPASASERRRRSLALLHICRPVLHG